MSVTKIQCHDDGNSKRIRTFQVQTPAQASAKQSVTVHAQNATIAPGMDDAEELNQEATAAEIKRGEYTTVTTLAYDEVDPSE